MIIVKPSVELMDRPTYMGPTEKLRHIEACGRVCYKSEGKIAQGSAERFVRMLLERGHEAAIEHVRITLLVDQIGDQRIRMMEQYVRMTGQQSYLTITALPHRSLISANVRAWRALCKAFRTSSCGLDMDPAVARMVVDNSELFPEYASLQDVIDAADDMSHELDPNAFDDPNTRRVHGWHTLRIVCDRGVSHELVRHRPVSFCQESTRYCNYSRDQFGSQISVIEPCYLRGSEGTACAAYPVWRAACEQAEKAYFGMLDAGCMPQEARAVLPNSLKTEVAMTATNEEWLHILRLRTSEAAHPQMRETAAQIEAALIQADPKLYKWWREDYHG